MRGCSRPPGTPSGATAADIRRLETLRAGWKAEADRLTIERWTYHQGGRRIHQYLADKHRRQIEAMQFEYVAAVRRARKRWDEAHGNSLFTGFSRNRNGAALIRYDQPTEG